jgi:hypothetical protein
MALCRYDIEVDRGFIWEALILLPGATFVSANLKGQIREDGLSTAVLASFRFDFPTYNAEEDQTEIRTYLPKVSTLKIPVTLPKQNWVYDIRADLIDGSSCLVVAGYVKVWEPSTQD